MKKLVASAAIAALLGSAAFAGVGLSDAPKLSIGGWGRGVWLTGNGWNGETNDKGENDGNDIYTSATKSWGGTGPRVGANISLETDNIGMFAEFHAEEQCWSDYRIWWSPVEQLKVFLGTNPNHFRGDAVYGMWDIYRTGVVDRSWKYDDCSSNSIKYGSAQQQEEGWTFMSHSCKGAQILATPIEELKLVAAFEFPLSKTGCYWSEDKSVYVTEPSSNVKNVFGRQSTFAAAYNIEGIGTVKAGLKEKDNVTVKDGKEKAQNILNVAFDLTAVENLYLSIGAFVPLVQKTVASSVESNGEEIGWGNQVNVFAKYNMDALTISGRIGTIIGTYDAKTNNSETSGIEATDGAFGFLVGAGVEYKIMDSLSVIGEVDYANGIYANRSTEDNMDVLDFGIAVSKSYSNGKIVAGFEGTTNNNNAPVNAYHTANNDDFGWCIPVCFEYWF